MIDFQSLFPSRDLSGCPLTVITISQKTMNDMTSWTPEVEEEREELMGLVKCIIIVHAQKSNAICLKDIEMHNVCECALFVCFWFAVCGRSKGYLQNP